MSQTARRHRISDAERYRAVTAARERFLAGDDRVRGVRPEVATSWYRCREQYHVDPGLSQAPPASGQEEPAGEHPPEHWCTGFDEWVCAGVAVRDAVTHDAVAVLDVSTWRSNLPHQAAAWLSRAVGGARAILRQRAQDRRWPPWTPTARWSSPTRAQACCSASPRGCPRSTPRCAGNRAWTSAGSPATPSSRPVSTT